jgi:hypothetical protein
MVLIGHATAGIRLDAELSARRAKPWCEGANRGVDCQLGWVVQTEHSVQHTKMRQQQTWRELGQMPDGFA